MHVFLQVGVRLNSLGDAAIGNKAFLDEHTSAMECVTKDAKRKWEIFAEQAENDCKVGSSSSAAKHCRMETMLQEWYVSTVTWNFLFICSSLKIRFSEQSLVL